MVGQPGLVRLGGYERFDVVDVGAGEALQLGYLHDPDALHGLDHLLPLVDVAGQFAEPAVRQRFDERGLAVALRTFEGRAEVELVAGLDTRVTAASRVMADAARVKALSAQPR
jgi:hypothetical protein